MSSASPQDVVKRAAQQGGAVPDMGKSAWEGFSGQKKTTYADVVDTALPEGWGEDSGTLEEKGVAGPLNFARDVLGFAPGGAIAAGLIDPSQNQRQLAMGVGGLAGDILLDPSNLIAGGLGTGAKAAKAASRAKKVVPEPHVDSVTGVSPMQQQWREITDPAEIEKYSIKTPDAGTGVPETVAPVPASNSQAIADQITAQAATPPEVVLPNTPRKAQQVTTLDNVMMGQHISSLTTKAAARQATAERARVKPPSFMKEINPDEYLASAQIAVDSTSLSARELSRIAGIDYKTAQRHIALMEKDGIIANGKESLKARGLGGNANSSHLARTVKVNEIPAELLINRVEPTDASRAAAMYDEVVSEARIKFDELGGTGAKPKIVATDGKGYTMSTADIFEAMPREIVENYNFGGLGGKGAANLYPSQWHAGAAEALRMSELGVEAEVAAPAIANAMRNALRGNASRAASIQSAGSVEAVAKAFSENMPALANKLVETSKKFGTKDLVDGEAIAKAKADDIQTALEQGTLSEAIDSVANVGNDISKAARQIGATDDAAVAAIQQVGPMVAKIVPEADIAAARNAKFAENVRIREGFTPQADKKIMMRHNRIYVLVERNADEIAREAGIPYLTLGEKADITMNGFHDKLMHPLKTAFQFGYHTGGQADLWRALESRADREGIMFRKSLRDISKKHGANVDLVWTAFRRGIVPSDPGLRIAYNDMKGVIDHTIGNGLRGRLWRNGASIDAVNQALDEAGSKFRFKKPAKPEDRVLVPEQVRDWDIKDPLPELEKINKAALLIETRQTVGVSASRFGSSVPKPGYVKLRPGDFSTLGNYLDTGLFFPREAGEFIQQLDKLIGSRTNFQGQKGGIAWFANHIIDPIMQIWKPFMTIARPGHVTRNLWSDIILASFNGVNSVRPYRIAAKTLQAAGEFTKTGVAGIDKLRDGIVSGADVAFKYRGKDISYQGLYKMAHENGLLQNWHSTEDIMEGATKLGDKLLHSKYMAGMGKVNEIEGQFARIAHFQGLLEKGIDVTEAAKQVRRFHPDVKGLTPFESKYLRRIFPFYSWFRQAMPVVLSTMLQKPGRVTGLFKAEYNVATAMGVNPDSIVDPFPDDKLYPKFIRDNIVGPLVGDWGANLGTPQEGLLGDTLNGSPARNIASMVNPLFKFPYEVASRNNVSTGANIADMSDYIDSNIPIVNQVANISGHSVTGLGAMQRQVEIGEKNRVFNTQLVNFLTGLGLMDTGKESYKNIATRERNQ
jgi:hypothetical protein